MSVSKFRLGKCEFCNGDLALNSDRYGDFWSCIQCGREDLLDVPSPDILKTRNPNARLGPRIGTRI